MSLDTAPTFLVEARVRECRILKEKHTKFVLEIGGRLIDAIHFNDVIDPGPTLTVHAKLEVKKWRGTRNVQLLIEHQAAA